MATILKTKKKGLNDKWVRRIGIPLIAVLLVLISDGSNNQISPRLFAFKIIRNIFFVFCYWENNRIIFIYMRSKYPNLKDTSKRIAVHVVIFLVYILVSGAVFAFINIKLLKLIQSLSFRNLRISY